MCAITQPSSSPAIKLNNAAIIMRKKSICTVSSSVILLSLSSHLSACAILRLLYTLNVFVFCGDSMSYKEGFEDAMELCISESEDVASKKNALERMKYILTLVKEDKFDRLKKELGILLSR